MDIEFSGEPEYKHFVKITYCWEWRMMFRSPLVGYAAYESRGKMEECRDNLIRCGNGAVEITREEYDAAIAEIRGSDSLAEIRPTPAEMEGE